MVELVKKPCQQAIWQCTSAVHELQPSEGGGATCTRCRLKARQQHVGQCGHSTCPVPLVTREGQRWPAGEASIRTVLGRVKGFRRWSCPRDLGEQQQQAAEGEAAEQEPPGAAAAGVEALREEVPLANVAPVLVPLASVAPLLVQCAARECTAASSVQADAEPGAKRARVDPAAGSNPPQRLQAYVGHWSMHLGRSLRCLRCFSKPSGDYRVWKRGRCLELQPLHSIPSNMVTDVLRAEPPGAGAPAGMYSRYATLVEWARRRPAIRSLATAAVRSVGPYGDSCRFPPPAGRSLMRFGR